MKLWSDFTPLMAMRLKDCPAFTIEDEVREAAIRFYEDSRAWRVEGVALGTTVASQADYTVTNPADTVLAGLPAVWINGIEVEETRPGSADDYAPGDTSDTNSVAVVAVNQIRLTPPPVTAGWAIVATVAYKPSDAATGISDELFYAHREAIIDRALSELMMQDGKPWASPNMAQFYANQYARSGLLAASDAGPRKRTPLRVRNSSY